MNISTEQSKTEFHYSGVRYSELVKNVFVLLWSVIVSCAFIGNALHCVVISGSLEELAGGTLGVLILFMGTPHFLQLLYVQLVLAFYLRERATKEKSRPQKLQKCNFPGRL